MDTATAKRVEKSAEVAKRLAGPVKASSVLGKAIEGAEPDIRGAVLSLIASAQKSEEARGITAQRPIAKRERCWALTDESHICDAGTHYQPLGPALGRCNADAVELWQGKLSQLLESFGIPKTFRGSVAQRLRDGWQTWRPVKIDRGDTGHQVPIDRLMTLLAMMVPQLGQRHGLLHGDSGTGKSYCAAMLFFSALEFGLQAAWVDDDTFRRIVVDMASFDTATRMAGEEAWRRLNAKQVIFYNDLAADEDPPLSSKPSHPLLALTLWKLFEHSRATIWATSNLAPTPPPPKEGDFGGEVRALSNHPDVSAKVVMRLCGERVNATKMQAAQDLAQSQGRQLSKEEWAACAVPALLLKFTGENQRFCSSTVTRAASKRATAQKDPTP